MAVVATARIEVDTLDRFLSLPVWDEPHQAPVPPIGGDYRKYRQAEIRALLAKAAGGFLADVPFVLIKPMGIGVRMGRIPAEKYLVLNEICDALRGHGNACVAHFDDNDAWTAAIRVGRDMISETSSGNYYLNHFSRDQAVALAGKRVEAQGFPIQISSHGVGFAPETLVAICAKIEQSVMQLGGQAIVEAIFRFYRSSNRFYHGTLLFGRIVDQMSNPREPQVPWHFLYNLALKHLDQSGPAVRDPAPFVAMLELARDMASVIDTETYSIIEGMTGIAHSRFHGALLDRVIYDELFAFPQWQPEVAPDLFCRLVDYIASEGAAIPLATADEWKAFARALLALAPEHDILLTRPNKCINHGISAGLANRMFEALALPGDELNRDYNTPLDTPARNAPYAPFYRLTWGVRYLVPPRALVSRGLYEAFYGQLRKAEVPGLENILGRVLEKLTVDAVSEAGSPPDIAREKYRYTAALKGKNIFDIDAMSFGEKWVLMLECKKKALTNVARGGNTLVASFDFMAGFLTPIIQTIRHELQLRDPAGLTLTDGRNFELGGRGVQRGAVTMTDHGSMQDGAFLRNMVIALWGVTLSSADPANADVANRINEKLAEMVEGVTAIAAANGETVENVLRGYAHNTWWFGIDQLFFFCRRASDLWTAFGPLRSTTFGTGDLMNEYAIADRGGFLTAAKRPQ